MRRNLLSLCFLCCCLAAAVAQPVRQIKGTVIDKATRAPLEFINVLLVETGKGATTDARGEFTLTDVPPGIYRLRASAVGYKSTLSAQYILSTKSLHVDLELEENPTELQGVTVSASPFRRSVEAPLGLRSIGLQEIEKSPGANRDISRIVQSYPGVAFSPAGYRNDLIVRGGGPAENRFFLDGVEIPNINHFSTQGASGGPVGIINADLIREVNFYTGAFPAQMGNALSSVLDFRLRDGDLERHSVKATLGASEVSLAANGSLSKKTSYLVSVRQSYLQFLFDMLGLPLLPTFTDAQFKTKTRFDPSNELTLLGLVGIDNMRLNTGLEGEKAEYILSYLPTIRQQTATLGAVYKHYAGAHVQTAVLSHSYLNNRNTKYRDNRNDRPEELVLQLRSVEQETKLRLENTTTRGPWRINLGTNLDLTRYTNQSVQRIYAQEERTASYQTTLNLVRWALFATAGYASANERFTASLALRADANNYSARMSNPARQLSPRIALAYQPVKRLFVSATAGRYYQLPPLTALGWKNNQNEYANKHLRYIDANQAAIGIAWRPAEGIELSAEAFYKQYNHVPLSVADGIPLACKGNDYGVVGNELLDPTAQGRAKGVELLVKWTVPSRLNLAATATLVRSDYRSNPQSAYIASAWDNRFIANLRATYNLPRNWSLGMKLSAIGGAPYTPYDEQKSSLVAAWDAQGRPYFDYARYNTERLPAYAQLDVRVDKTFYLKRCMLGFYIDLQNATMSTLKQPDILMSTGEIDTDATGAPRYRMKRIAQESGTLLPTLGITFEY